MDGAQAPGPSVKYLSSAVSDGRSGIVAQKFPGGGKAPTATFLPSLRDKPLWPLTRILSKR